jgi:hypothetical protein
MVLSGNRMDPQFRFLADRGLSLSARDTVDFETPANFAMSQSF